MAQFRTKFETGGIYHIFNKSIAGFKIFQDISNGERFIKALDYYNGTGRTKSFSSYLDDLKEKGKNLEMPQLLIPKENSIVKFLSHTVMPDHYHIVIKAIIGKLVPKYISDVENSFSRFFNIKFKRKGPMWQHRFKSVIVRSDGQCIHLIRYVNLNATTSGLVENPADWILSSYKDLIDEKQNILKNYLPEISISSPKEFKQFVENHKDHQRKLKLIKKLILE